MTAFEKMRIEQLLGVIDKCCLNEDELRELREQINARVVQKRIQKENEGIYGKPKDGRCFKGRRRKITASKSEIKRRLCLSGKLYKTDGKSKRLETVSSDRKESKRG